MFDLFEDARIDSFLGTKGAMFDTVQRDFSVLMPTIRTTPALTCQYKRLKSRPADERDELFTTQVEHLYDLALIVWLKKDSTFFL
jgi:hypothetical protein